MALTAYKVRWWDRILYAVYWLCRVKVNHTVGGKWGDDRTIEMKPIWFYQVRRWWRIFYEGGLG